MHLKSVKLVGFKSFVDPITIPMMYGINGVVGPNGCGKSNIIDAVRWVIGERSAKQLRGQSMADVIFNGTSGRKPVGRASVELLFDNTDGSWVGSCASFAEVAIKREVFRDGQSHYYLNGTACRRQDIVDIFYGTGLTSRSYAIIEQGMISRLIEAKPDELRAHLEEAAGISKYKQRRQDTENRMARTEENLNRLIDVRDELEKQLKHLQRQASAAERYNVLRDEEREIMAQIKALHWKQWQADLSNNQEKITAIDTERERLNALWQRVETDIQALHLTQLEATDRHHDAQKEFYRLGGEITRVEQEIKHTRDQLERWQRELHVTTQRFEELSESTADYDMQISELSQAVASLRPQAASLTERYQIAAKASIEAEKQMQAWTDAWESQHKEEATISKAWEVSHTKSLHYQQERDHLAARLQRLKHVDYAVQLDQLQVEKLTLNKQLEAHRQEGEAHQIELDSLWNHIQQKKLDIDAAQKALHEKQTLVQTQLGRQASLEALQEAALAIKDQSVAQWLDAHQLLQAPRLGKQITVAAGWELAVETVLKGLLDAVCIDNLEAMIDAFTPLHSGELMLLAAATYSTSPSHQRVSLASKVVSDWPVSEWLGQVFTVDSLDEAKALRYELQAHESFITRDGIWLGKHWLRVAKAIQNEDSILLRDQEITQLTASILELKNDVLTLEAELVFLKESLLDLECRREESHRKAQSLHHVLMQKQSQLTEKETLYDTLIQREHAVRQELLECHERDTYLHQQLTAMSEEMLRYEQQLASTTLKKEALGAERQGLINALALSRQQAQEAKQQTDEYAIRLSSNENQLAILQQTMARDVRQLDQLDEQRDYLTEQLSHADDPLNTLRHTLQQHLDQQLRCEQTLAQASQFLEECNQKRALLEKQKQESQLSLNQLQATHQQLHLERQEMTVRQTTLVEQLQELGTSLDLVLSTLPAEAILSAWEERATEVASRISRLGPINLAAIEEHAVLKERKEYLDTQHADLDQALSLLRNAIHKIDKETRGKFKETFDRVNQEFQQLFPKIFGGGHAALELDNDDFLLAGVVVKAQPPGKRNATIHMLSGGEKALTAIALVFGLFQLHPAPFCILDEVDAPLDDINVGRYCRLIAQMASKIQFIVISHNKVTIESCDRLLGITMQEPGVSRVVTVNIEEAVSLAEA